MTPADRMTSHSSALRIAIIGTRGVPPAYGGFETFAAELGVRLVARGHSVTVYCRPGRTSSHDTLGAESEWRGIRRVELPAIRHKYLETVSHSLLSAVHAIGRGFDAALVCNAANAFVLPLLRAARIPVSINVDGIERKRKKWNALGRAIYLIGESLSVSTASAVVADAEVIARYYRERFGREPIVIPYGSEFPADEIDSDVLGRLGLTTGRYILYVSRFEPENNPLAVVSAYAGVPGDLPLVMLGDAPYSAALKESVKRAADSRVILPGALYGADYRTLQKNARFYIQATEVGGTHPALIEAMRSGGAVLANDTPENREVGGEAVGYFSLDAPESLSSMMTRWLAPEFPLDELREKARERSRSLYSWDRVTNQYEALFRELAGGSQGLNR